MTAEDKPLPLKPCPFCGGIADVWGTTEVTIRCRECLTLGQPRWELADAAKAWNRRAPSSPDAAREALVEALKRAQNLPWANGKDTPHYKSVGIPLDVFRDFMRQVDAALAAHDAGGPKA